MRVKLLGIWASPEGNFQPGHVMDISDERAMDLLAQRMVELVEVPVQHVATVNKTIITTDLKKRRTKL